MRRLRPGRVLVLLAVVLGLFLTLFARLGQMQVVEREAYVAAADRTNTRTVVIPAVRGRILAKDGTPLVDNDSVATVTVQRETLLAQADGGRSLLARLATALGVPEKEVWGRTFLCGTTGAPAAPTCWGGSAYVPIPVAQGVDVRRALAVAERPETFPGVSVEAEPVRRYPGPRGVVLAQVLGYLGRATGAEVARSHGEITDQDLVGRAGLEAQYDARLRGRPGRITVAVDERGVVLREVSRTDPVPGEDVRTNLDLTVQARAETALRDGLAAARKRGEKADAGGAVVLDTRTGAVVASASWPTYDPAVWTGGISAKAYAAITDPTAGTPLLDRVTAATFPPASTFKVISVRAAVAAGNSLAKTYECGSAYRIGNRDFHNYESRAYGRIGMVRAMEVSCDTIFYDFAYREWLALGGLDAASDARDPFVASAREFGLGARTGVDLPGESAGRIPDRTWKRRTWEETKATTCAHARSGYPEVARTDPTRAAYLTALAVENCRTGFQYRAGDAANFAIGQGDISVTPLQMAVAFGAVANGGTLVTPSFVGTRPASGSVAFAPGMLSYLRTALRGVVERGTAAGALAGVPRDWPIAGKTGTGEVFGKGDTAWFVSYAPATAPRYVVAVAVSQGGTGAGTAAPIAKAIHLALRAAR